jgi:hypothetical protein
MDYNHINSFFDKFKKVIYQKEEIKKIIKDIISKNISFEIENNFFNYKNGVIYLKCSPVIKNEIMIHKDKILRELRNELKENFNVLDIR